MSSNAIPIRTCATIQAVDDFVDKCLKDAAKFTNIDLLDDSQVYELHDMVARIFAWGFDEGFRAASQQQHGEHRRRRDREAEAAKNQPAPEPALISRVQVHGWAGDALTDDEFERLHEAIPHSSIPDAINTIVNESIRGGR